MFTPNTRPLPGVKTFPGAVEDDKAHGAAATKKPTTTLPSWGVPFVLAGVINTNATNVADGTTTASNTSTDPNVTAFAQQPLRSDFLSRTIVGKFMMAKQGWVTEGVRLGRRIAEGTVEPLLAPSFGTGPSTFGLENSRLGRPNLRVAEETKKASGLWKEGKAASAAEAEEVEGGNQGGEKDGG